MDTLRSLIQEMHRLSNDADDAEDRLELDRLAELVEQAGFTVPDDLDPEDFLAAVEQQVLEAKLDEKLGQRIRAAYHKVKSAFSRKKKPAQARAPHQKPQLWRAGRSREIARNM